MDNWLSLCNGGISENCNLENVSGGRENSAEMSEVFDIFKVKVLPS